MPPVIQSTQSTSFLCHKFQKSKILASGFVAGAYSSVNPDVKTMALSTANGKSLSVKVDGSDVMVDNAKVIKTDVICRNGIIHWIDTVVLP